LAFKKAIEKILHDIDEALAVDLDYNSIDSPLGVDLVLGVYVEYVPDQMVVGLQEVHEESPS